MDEKTVENYLESLAKIRDNQDIAKLLLKWLELHKQFPDDLPMDERTKRF